MTGIICKIIQNMAMTGSMNQVKYGRILIRATLHLRIFYRHNIYLCVMLGSR